MINLILMNLVVLLSSWLVTRCFLRFTSIADFLTSFIVLFFTQIVLTLQLLGVLNLLSLNNAIILNLLALLLICLIVKFTNSNPSWPFQIRQTISKLHFSKLHIFILSIISGFIIVKLAVNLVNPPFGWDNLSYHFTFPVEWLKHQNLANPIVAFCDPSPTYYPINGSLVFFWFILPLKNVFIADLAQLPFFILAFLAVYSIARKISLSRSYSFFAASIFALVPNYFKQLSIAYVDIMVAALFLAALNYLFLLNKEFSVKNTLLFAICAGLMVGIKTTAFSFSVLLFIPFLYFTFRQKNIKKGALIIIFCLFILALIGGFSYVRNFIETGNPLYPLNLTIFNKVIFKGVMDSFVYRAHFIPYDYSLGKIFFSEGLGAQALLFFLPGILLGLPVIWLKRRRELDFNLVYFLILPFLLILVYRFVIPLGNLRYIYCLFGIASIISFYVASVLKIPRKIIKTILVIFIVSSAAQFAKRQELVSAFLLSAALFFLFPYLFKILKDKISLKIIVFFLISFCLALSFLEKDYKKNEYSRYMKMTKYSGFWPDAAKAWAWLNENTKGENISYAGRPAPFPLYGQDFKNNVYYTSVNKTDPAKLQYFPDSRYVWGYDGESVHKSFEQENNYRGHAEFSIWFKNLGSRRTDYLFVYSLHQIKSILFPIEDEWAHMHPESFDLVFRNDTIHIYKIR